MKSTWTIVQYVGGRLTEYMSLITAQAFREELKGWSIFRIHT